MLKKRSPYYLFAIATFCAAFVCLYTASTALCLLTDICIEIVQLSDLADGESEPNEKENEQKTDDKIPVDALAMLQNTLAKHIKPCFSLYHTTFHHIEIPTPPPEC